MNLKVVVPPLLVLAGALTLLDAQDGTPPLSKDRHTNSARDAVTLLKSRCFGCHGAQQQMGGLRLDSREGAMRGGYSGPVIKPGKSSESTLIQLVTGIDPKRIMPLSGHRLASGEINTLRHSVDRCAH